MVKIEPEFIPWLALAGKITLLLGFALAVFRLLSRANPRWRIYTGELTVALVLLLPLAGMLPFSLSIPVDSGRADSSLIEEKALAPSVAAPGEMPSTDPGGSIAAGLPSRLPDWNSGTPQLGSAMLFGLLYGVGLSWFGWRFVAGRNRLRRAITGFERADAGLRSVLESVATEFHLESLPTLRIAKEPISPFCTGGGGGTIVIPEWLADPDRAETLRMVLRHEVHHLANRDPLRSTLMSAAAAVLWIHPLIWILRRCHSAAVEELSDRIAAGSGKFERRRYRAMLAGLALHFRGARPAGATALGMARTPEIVGRLRRLQRVAPHEPLRVWRRFAVAIGLAVPLLVLTGVLEIEAAGVRSFAVRFSGEEPEAIDAVLDPALKAVAASQSADGSFKPDGSSEGLESGVTALAGMAFLGHGGTDDESPWHDAFSESLDYVLECQGESGGFNASPDRDFGNMYHHCIATWFLASAREHAGEKRRARIDNMLPKAVRVIVDAQAVEKIPAAQGGWRYTPASRDSDLSVSAWAIRALHAAGKAGVEIPDRVFDDAMAFVLRLQNDDGGFGYVPAAAGARSNVPRTAMALDCLYRVGRGDSEAAGKARAYLLEEYAKPQKGYEFYAILWTAAALSKGEGEEAKAYAAWMVEHCRERQADGRWESSFGDILGTIFVLQAFSPPD